MLAARHDNIYIYICVCVCVCVLILSYFNDHDKEILKDHRIFANSLYQKI